MSQPLSVCMIGAGRWGKVYLKTLRELNSRYSVNYLVTSKPENRSLVTESTQIHTDWKNAVEAHPDVCMAAVPPSLHPEIIQACLDRNIPLIIEKPVCLNLQEAERLRDLVEKKSLPVLVNHIQLFNPWYHALKADLQTQEEYPVWMLSEGMSLGPFRSHIPALWDWGPHDISLMLDLMGHPPQQVSALAIPSRDSEPEQWNIRLDFEQNRAGWIQAGRLAATKRRSLTVYTDHWLYRWDEQASEDEQRLLRSRIDLDRRYEKGLPERISGEALSPSDERMPMSVMLNYFADALDGGPNDYLGLDLAVETVRVLETCAAVGATR